MLAMIQKGLKRLSTSAEDKPVIEAIAAVGEGGASPPQLRLPSEAPVISSDSDDQ